MIINNEVIAYKGHGVLKLSDDYTTFTEIENAPEGPVTIKVDHLGFGYIIDYQGQLWQEQ